MTIESQFLESLSKINVQRESRLSFADWLLNESSRIGYLLTYNFKDADQKTKATWGLDLVVEKEPHCLNPYLNYYIEFTRSSLNDSILRVLNRINFHFLNHQTKNNIALSKLLTEEQMEHFITFSFDALLNKNSTATSAFAMSTLAIFASEKTWVRENLISYIQANYHNESKGFQARARHILKELK